MKSYAIVIELTENIRLEAISAMKKLKHEQKISFIYENTPCPHFMLVNNLKFKDLDKTKIALKSLCLSQKNFKVKSNGLGIFVKEKPVLYIRWLITENLTLFKKKVYNEIGINEDLNWIPKSTLAWKDTTYQTLEKSLLLLLTFNFELVLNVSSVCLYQFEEKKKEKKINEFIFHR